MSMIAFIELHATAFVVAGLLTACGIISQRLLIQYGFVRGGAFSAAVAVVITVAVWQIWFPTASWCVVTPVVVLAMTLGANRADLWTTVNRGRWWWKSKGSDEP